MAHFYYYYYDFRKETGTDAKKGITQTQFGGAEVVRDILDSGFGILQRFIVRSRSSKFYVRSVECETNYEKGSKLLTVPFFPLLSQTNYWRCVIIVVIFHQDEIQEG